MCSSVHSRGRRRGQTAAMRVHKMCEPFLDREWNRCGKQWRDPRALGGIAWNAEWRGHSEMDVLWPSTRPLSPTARACELSAGPDVMDLSRQSAKTHLREEADKRFRAD